MHWQVEMLINEVRALDGAEDRFAHWEAGYVCGQINMLVYVPGVEMWEIVYVRNLYDAKRHKHMKGV